IGGEAHSSLLGSVLVVRHSRLSPNVAERPIVVIVIQDAGGRVAGNVNIWPAVMVEIRRQRSKSVTSRCVENAGFLRDVGEGAIAVVVIEGVHARLETPRPAHYVNPLPLTPAALSRPRHGVVAEFDIAHH